MAAYRGRSTWSLSVLKSERDLILAERGRGAWGRAHSKLLHLHSEASFPLGTLGRAASFDKASLPARLSSRCSAGWEQGAPVRPSVYVAASRCGVTLRPAESNMVGERERALGISNGGFGSRVIQRLGSQGQSPFGAVLAAPLTGHLTSGWSGAVWIKSLAGDV